MSPSLRVVVADDHALVRAGLIEIINGFPEFDVVGEAATGRAAIAAASRLRPDVLLLDLDMPDTCDPRIPRARTAAAVLASSPTTKVVVLTLHDDPGTVRDLVLAGASAYLTKTSGPDELRGVLLGVTRGTGTVTIAVSRPTMLDLCTSHTPAPVLTAREREILGLVATGASNRELADQLHIAEATAKRHVDKIFKKLGVRSRINAVNRARELRIL